MAIVADLARTTLLAGANYNTTYQKGNSHPDTPDPTWLTADAYPDGALITETHIPFAYEAPVVSNTDAWLPLQEETGLNSVSATDR